MAPATWPVRRMIHSPVTMKPIWRACWAGAWPISRRGCSDDRNEEEAADPAAGADRAGRALHLVVPARQALAGDAAGVHRTAVAAGHRPAPGLAARVLLGRRAGADVVQPWRDERLDPSRHRAAGLGGNRAVAA